jgi:hypothetical protein
LRWGLNIALGFDQLGNTIWGGCPDETISSRLGRIKEKNGGKIPWYRPARYLAWALDKIQKDHCENAIEHDEEQEIENESVFDKLTR